MIRVTPTSRILVAFGPNSASSAPRLMCISPLAKPSEWAIHFFTLLTGLFDGMKRVQTVRLSLASRSTRMLSFLPLAMITVMPSSATFCAMLHLVSMPPRPNDDLLVCTYSDRSSLLPSISRITVEDGSDGLPLYMPSILLRIIKASIPIMVAISPESSSLSVNINSVTDIVSFSFTMGITLFSSITSIQCFWLR